MSEKQYSKVYFLCQAPFCIILPQGVTLSCFCETAKNGGFFWSFCLCRRGAFRARMDVTLCSVRSAAAVKYNDKEPQQ